MDSRQLQLVLTLNDQMTKELRKISGELGSVEKSASKSGSMFGGMAKSIAQVAAAYVSFQTAYSSLSLGVQVAADLQTAEIGLKTLLGSADEAAATVARLKQEAARTPFELRGLTQATQLLTAVTKDGNKSIDVILDIGEGLAAMGKGQGELDRIIVNLQQIAAVGKAATIDIKQFAFAGIPIYEMLAETTGKTGEALNELIEGGGVTFDLLTKMFDEANDEGGRFFNAYVNQAGSFNQASANMKDSFAIMMADIAKSSGLFDGLTNAMMGAADFMMNYKTNIEELRTSIKQFAEEHGLAIAMVAGAITAVLLPVIYGAVVAFGAMAIAGITAFAAIALAAAPLIIAGALIAGAAYLIYDNWGAIKEFFVDIWDTVKSATVATFNFIGSVITGAWEGLKTIFWTYTNFIVGLWATMLDFFIPGWEGMLGTLLGNMIAGWEMIKTAVGDALAALTELLSGWYATVKEAWTGMWTAVSDSFGGIWQGIVDAFNVAKTAILDLMDELIEPIEKIIKMAQKAIDLASNALGAGGKWVSGAVSKILERGSSITGNRATGGSVAGGRSYVVGENGPEMFVPQGNGTIVPEYRMGGSGGGIIVNVYGDVTGEDIIDKVERGLAKRIKERIRTA